MKKVLDEEGAGVPGELGPAIAVEGLPVGPGAVLVEVLLEPGDLAHGRLATASWRQWTWTSRIMMV